MSTVMSMYEDFSNLKVKQKRPALYLSVSRPRQAQQGLHSREGGRAGGTLEDSDGCQPMRRASLVVLLFLLRFQSSLAAEVRTNEQKLAADLGLLRRVDDKFDECEQPIHHVHMHMWRSRFVNVTARPTANLLLSSLLLPLLVPPCHGHCQ